MRYLLIFVMVIVICAAAVAALLGLGSTLKQGDDEVSTYVTLRPGQEVTVDLKLGPEGPRMAFALLPGLQTIPDLASSKRGHENVRLARISYAVEAEGVAVARGTAETTAKHWPMEGRGKLQLGQFVVGEIKHFRLILQIDYLHPAWVGASAEIVVFGPPYALK